MRHISPNHSQAVPKKGTRKACHSLSTPRKPVGLLGCSWLSAQSWLPGVVFFSNGSSIWCKTEELDKVYKKLSRLCFYIFSWLLIHSGHDSILSVYATHQLFNCFLLPHRQGMARCFSEAPRKESPEQSPWNPEVPPERCWGNSRHTPQHPPGAHQAATSRVSMGPNEHLLTVCWCLGMFTQDWIAPADLCGGYHLEIHRWFKNVSVCSGQFPLLFLHTNTGGLGMKVNGGK